MWHCRGSQALEVEDDGDGGVAGALGVRFLGEEGEVVKAELLGALDVNLFRMAPPMHTTPNPDPPPPPPPPEAWQAVMAATNANTQLIMQILQERNRQPREPRQQSESLCYTQPVPC